MFVPVPCGQLPRAWTQFRKRPEKFLQPGDVFLRTYRFLLIGSFRIGTLPQDIFTDQTERGVVYQYHMEHAAALPEVVGHTISS